MRTLERLTILDPACGSGAFLVHALERVADLLAQQRRLARRSAPSGATCSRGRFTASTSTRPRCGCASCDSGCRSRSRVRSPTQPSCFRCRISIATSVSAIRSPGNAFGPSDVRLARFEDARRVAPALRALERRAKGIARSAAGSRRTRARTRLHGRRVDIDRSAPSRPRCSASRPRSVWRAIPSVARREDRRLDVAPERRLHSIAATSHRRRWRASLLLLDTLRRHRGPRWIRPHRRQPALGPTPQRRRRPARGISTPVRRRSHRCVGAGRRVGRRRPRIRRAGRRGCAVRRTLRSTSDAKRMSRPAVARQTLALARRRRRASPARRRDTRAAHRRFCRRAWHVRRGRLSVAGRFATPQRFTEWRHAHHRRCRASSRRHDADVEDSDRTTRVRRFRRRTVAAASARRSTRLRSSPRSRASARAQRDWATVARRQMRTQ